MPQNYSTDNLDSGLSNAPYTVTEPAQSEFSADISRPSTRPHNYGHSRNDSMPITRVLPSEINMVEVRGAPRAKVSAVWSPHLWHDRSSAGKRRSLFIAPSLNEQDVSKRPNRRNMQVVLFVVGFVFPLGRLASYSKGHSADNAKQLGSPLRYYLCPPNPSCIRKGMLRIAA